MTATTTDLTTQTFHDHYRTLNEARFVDARLTIRTSLLINGVGAIAALGFAALQAKGSVPHTIAFGFISFSIGVALAAAAALSAYLANSHFAVHRSRQILSGELPGADDLGSPAGRRWQARALLSAVASLAMFLAGSLLMTTTIAAVLR